MNNIFYLLKVQMLSFFGINKALHTKQKKDAKKSMGIIGILLLAILFIAMSFLYNGGIAVLFKSMGLLDFYLPMVMMFTSFIILMTTLYKGSGVLFDGKDYDLLGALPIKTSDIVASRVLVLYFMNLIFLGIIMIPAAIVYGVVAKPSLAFYGMYGLTLFFIPLIPIIIATFIGAVITVVAIRFKRTQLISLILNLILLMGIMSISFGSTGTTSEELTQLSKVMMDTINQVYPLANLYLQAVCQYNIVALILFVGCSIGAFVLFSVVLGMQFKKIHTMLHTTHRSNNYRVGEMRVSSALHALYRKELKRYFSSSMYVMNTGIGAMLMLMFAISLIFLDGPQIEQMLEIPNFNQYMSEFAPLVASLFMVMNGTTACAISLEGKNLWILKASPIPVKNIFLSKIGVQLTLTIPAILLNGIIMTVVLKLSLLESIMVFVLPTCYTLFIGIMGIIINLKYPNLEWTSEVVVIKQSAATLISMLVGILSLVIPSVLMICIPGISTQVELIGVTLIMVILISLAYHYMKTKGEQLFRAL